MAEALIPASLVLGSGGARGLAHIGAIRALQEDGRCESPDVLIEIPSDACSVLDFHRADELIELGYRRAQAALQHAGGEPIPR